MVFELKKFLDEKSIKFLIVFILAFGLIIPMAINIGYIALNKKAGYRSINEVAETIEDIEPKIIQSFTVISELQNNEQEILVKNKVPVILSTYLYESKSAKAFDTIVAQSYYRAGVGPVLISKLQESGNPRSLSAVNIQLSASTGARLTYYSKQYDMLVKIGAPSAEYTHFMELYEWFENMAMLVIVIFLIFTFGNIGAIEDSTSMYLIIYSSAIDNKKIMINKLKAFNCMGCGALLIINILYAINFIVFGYADNLDIKLNSMSLDFTYCPYSISVGTYFILKFVFQVLAIMVLSVLVLYISMRIKSTIAAIAVSSFFTVGGIGLAAVGFNRSVFVRTLLAGGIMPKYIFKDFGGIVAGGKVFLYPVVYAVYMIAIIIIMTSLIMITCETRKYSVK